MLEHTWLHNLGEGICFAFFFYYDVHNVLVKDFLIARHGHFFAIFLEVYFTNLTSFTRLEHRIHVVLMNLQDIGQASIKVAQRGATTVQVCSLNPAG
jgi:hypothetical protein